MKSGALVFVLEDEAGQSTRSKPIVCERDAVLISEGKWCESFYLGEISTFDEYERCSRVLKPLLQTHVEKISRTGTNVVMDFPENNKRQRE